MTEKDFERRGTSKIIQETPDPEMTRVIRNVNVGSIQWHLDGSVSIVLEIILKAE